MTARRDPCPDFLITADADAMSGREFFECLFGKRSPEEIAARKAAAEEYSERRHREFIEETARLRRRTAEMIRQMRVNRGACVRCGEQPVREVLDGDPLCQSCCDAWVRGERDAA